MNFKTIIKLSCVFTWFALILSGCGSTAKNSGISVPRMVYIPSGHMVQGDLSLRNELATPPRNVKVDEFFISETEVTLKQYSECVKQRACERISTASNSSDYFPVTGLSFEQVEKYLSWLSDQDGKSYRLPSESEWEYVARAGNEFVYGSTASERSVCQFANVLDAASKDEYSVRSTAFDCDDNYTELAEVKTYLPNAFGLFGVIGNASEITEDCWNNNYEGAPEDGSAWESGDCEATVVRGGSYKDGIESVSVFHRSFVKRTERRDDVGFRVAYSESLLNKLKKKVDF